MEKKKALVINCSLCDARSVQESTLSAYEKISINTSILLTSPESRALLNQYPLTVNADQTVDVEGMVTLSSINGRGKITPAQKVPAGKMFLVVNGVVDVEAGTEEILSHYIGIAVNGRVACPESLAGQLPLASVNGVVETYPDGCVRLKRSFQLDHTFPLRARQGEHYYAARHIVALDQNTDFTKLAEKEVHFTTKSLLVAESLAEAAIPLFDPNADVVILPDGCAFVGDDAVLDEALLERYGGKLYINGNLTINKDSASCLEKVSYLHINGDLLAVRSMEEAARKLHAEYGQLKSIAGCQICDRVHLNVDRTMLENAEDGVDIFDCVNVTFRKDVSPELIQEKVLSLYDCVGIKCTEEQQGVIESIATDVVSINGPGLNIFKAAGLPEVLLNLFGGVDGMSEEEQQELAKKSKIVNAATYVL